MSGVFFNLSSKERINKQGVLARLEEFVKLNESKIGSGEFNLVFKKGILSRKGLKEFETSLNVHTDKVRVVFKETGWGEHDATNRVLKKLENHLFNR